MKKTFILVLILGIVIAWNAGSLSTGENPHGDIEFDCELCHSTADWSFRGKDIEFRHDQTGYPLIGAHAEAGCRSCHRSLIFAHIGIACIDCHTDIHAGELGMDCQNCHTPVSWENRFPVWEEHNMTRFPLLGYHAALDCESCHRGPAEKQFTNLPVTCEGCHEENYSNSLNPNHLLAGFDRQCESCHSPAAMVWQQVYYTHPGSFPLRGAHAGTDCISCHESGYAGTGNQCEDCHMDDYNATYDPEHVSFGFPTVCVQCHNEFNWHDAVFDHLAQSGFALVGSHTRIFCTNCHVNNQVSGLPHDCFGCHNEDYNATTEPAHAVNNLSHECLDCHSQEVWSPSTFDHNAVFPLTGAHINADCISCHESGYSGTPTECYACHETDFSGVQDPNHITNNFSHDCAICHTTSAWSPSQIDHNQTGFPLTGAHITVTCISCHEAGYAGTPTECFACHQNDYDGTTDPSHLAAAFPTTCESCHNTTAWDQTTWDHDSQYFPIYSGSHREKWSNCNECHLTPSSYKLFECIYCHEHNKTDMDNKHREESGYQYQSTFCYDCHPDGRVND